MFLALQIVTRCFVSHNLCAIDLGKRYKYIPLDVYIRFGLIGLCIIHSLDLFIGQQVRLS